MTKKSHIVAHRRTDAEEKFAHNGKQQKKHARERVTFLFDFSKNVFFRFSKIRLQTQLIFFSPTFEQWQARNS